ncbi:MAG TPA: type I-B CRISPR-associated protein Cas7/Cst2/DevR [Bacteroidetes bacterium]|nr:type I-B CRISPR-associated protein Cas7/Cst2/DevR [Bacteroidota bacterium]
MKQTTQGFVLIDVDVASLNNAGENTTSNFNNSVATKKIFKDKKAYVYVSGQAWRYWWRDTLQKQFGWELSPIIRGKKIAFTEANPYKYNDDDIFGYMKATKDVEKDEENNSIKDKKGQEKTKDATVTRISPLKNSALISVTPVNTAENWSSMSRQEGDAVPFTREEYSAILKGMFSIDINQVGTFSDYNKSGYKNITEKLKKEILENDGIEINDNFLNDENGNPKKLVQIGKVERVKRITDTISALKFISGGAMQTTNMADVTPKLVILATFSTSNHPFSHVAGMGKLNNFEFKIDALKEVLLEYNSKLISNIYIGIRNGFLDEMKSEIEKMRDELNNLDGFKNFKIIFNSVNEAIDSYCEELKNLIK